MEKLMQYLWANRLQLHPGMKTVDNRPLIVIDPGRLNVDSGPDFFNAKVRIDDQVWAGNVEIHVRASDWHRHGHDSDPAYHSVILHVVGISDTRISAPDGRLIPQIELPADARAITVLSSLKSASNLSLPCAATIDSINPLYVTDWLSSLSFERLYEKADRVIDLVNSLDGDWESAAYITLARALGFNTNSDPFERLARATPLNIIRKHADDPSIIEALLLGQAGLIPPSTGNDYRDAVAREYSFLANKFSLQPPPLQWKMARMRPQSFPHRRIALLARILCRNTSLLSEILAVTDISATDAIFNCPLKGFWSHAYTFTAPTPASIQSLSRQSLMSIIINVVIPIKIAWGTQHDRHSLVTEAVDMLHNIPAEDNRLTRIFAATSIKNDNAFTSQALIQLRRAYCEKSDCLRCRFARHALHPSPSAPNPR